MKNNNYKNMYISDVPFKVTVFTSNTKPLNKFIELKDGKLSKTSNGSLINGKVDAVECHGLKDFSDELIDLPPNNAFALGRPHQNDQLIESAEIVINEIYKKTNQKEEISRTKDFFKFVNEPTLFFFDIDDYVGSPDDIWEILCNIDPQLKKTGHLIVHSSSSYIYNKETGEELKGPGGLHIYCIAKNGSDIPRYGEVFSQRAWLKGHGNIKISKSGSLLVRQIIDEAVYSPERLIFEAAPSLSENLEQRKPDPELIDGELLDTELLQDLTANEQKEFEKLVAEAKEKAKPEAEKKRDEYIEQQAGEMNSTSGIDIESAKNTVRKSLENGILYGPQFLKFDDFGIVTVEDVLNDPKKYDNRSLADPIEHDYNGGRNIAKFYWNEGKPIVHSFARGGKNYQLQNESEISGDKVFALTEVLDPMSFPDIVEWGSTIKIKSTVENLDHLLSCYGIKAQYDVIKKDQKMIFPEGYQECPDFEANAKLAEIKSLCNRNGIPKSTVELMGPIFSKNVNNPVINFIESKPWDGIDRISELISSVKVKPHCEKLWPIVFRKWLIQCVAAADGGEKTANPYARKKYESVLVFVGGQGISKTTFFNRLIPKELSSYFADGVHLDPKDKDSVKMCISNWIVELGELDVTFRRADIAALKAFLSKEVDGLRLPYDRVESTFQRRTSFCASVNDVNFLIDPTGNRRYWPIAIESITLLDNLDIQQVWAQARHCYINGEQWWPDADMEELLKEAHAEHEQENPMEDALAAVFDLEQPNLGDFYTNFEILKEIEVPESTMNSKNISNILKKYGFENKRTNKGRGFIITRLGKSSLSSIHGLRNVA